MARAAEHAGFDSIWLGDHLLYRERRAARARTVGGLDAPGGARGGDRARDGRTARRLCRVPPARGAREDGRHGRRGERSDDWSWLSEQAGTRRSSTRSDCRSTIARRGSRRRSRSSGGCSAGERVTLHGTYWQVDDAVLLPKPARRPPLMIGSGGERVLSIALPHVDRWNTWFDWYGNTPEGFAARNAEIDAAVERAGAGASRDPAQRLRACRDGSRRGANDRSIRTHRRSRAPPNGSPRGSWRWRRPAPTR